MKKSNENISENIRQRNNYHIINNAPLISTYDDQQPNRNFLPIDNQTLNRYPQHSHMSHI
jgi:hypothetical protein